MNKTAKTAINNLTFLIPFAIVWGIMLAFAVEHPGIDGHLTLNTHHNTTLDWIFSNITYLGAGLPTVIGVLMLLWSVRKGLLILISQLVNLILTQIPKFIINAPRPVEVFAENRVDLPPLVEGVALHTSRSFPSGHTSAAFALCFCIALLIPDRYRWTKTIIAVVAIAAAYSRIYLSQHFLADTLAGSLIGIVSAFITYICMYDRGEWGEKPLYNYIKRR